MFSRKFNFVTLFKRVTGKCYGSKLIWEGNACVNKRLYIPIYKISRARALVYNEITLKLKGRSF